MNETTKGLLWILAFNAGIIVSGFAILTLFLAPLGIAGVVWSCKALRHGWRLFRA